jgi:hypothetical protein
VTTVDEISSYFENQTQTEVAHSWHSRVFSGDGGSEAELSELLARKIMAYRCRPNLARLEAWERQRLGEAEADETTRSALRIIVKSGIGLPDQPKSDNHIQAFIAEHLWYFLVLEGASDDTIIRVEGPSVEVNEQGGDGLVLSRSGGVLTFRLWETKKYQGAGTVKRTITRACSQLSKNAERYLNKYSHLGTYVEDEEVARFYGRLLDMWIDTSQEASVGISIGTSVRSVPPKCFGAMPGRFPKLAGPERLIGLTEALDDFGRFSLQVRDEIWSGL